MEQIELELSEKLYIDSVIEQGALNDHLFAKYFAMIRNADSFEKIVNDSLSKHGYKVLRTGSGNIITNPSRMRSEAAEV